MGESKTKKTHNSIKRNNRIKISVVTFDFVLLQKLANDDDGFDWKKKNPEPEFTAQKN